MTVMNGSCCARTCTPGFRCMDAGRTRQLQRYRENLCGWCARGDIGERRCPDGGDNACCDAGRRLGRGANEHGAALSESERLQPVTNGAALRIGTIGRWTDLDVATVVVVTEGRKAIVSRVTGTGRPENDEGNQRNGNGRGAPAQHHKVSVGALPCEVKG
jgi:hypothetical protein